MSMITWIYVCVWESILEKKTNEIHVELNTVRHIFFRAELRNTRELVAEDILCFSHGSHTDKVFLDKDTKSPVALDDNLAG